MALIAAILGLPLFFEVGVVLLVPVVILVALRLDIPIMRVGIPALAGLSILHGLVPPHPGPLVAIDALGADLGLTLLFGLLVAAPTLVICGPLARQAHRAMGADARHHGRRGHGVRRPRRQPRHQPRRRLRDRVGSADATEGDDRIHASRRSPRGSPTVRDSSPPSSASRCR